MKFEGNLFKFKFLSLFADDTEKGVFCIFFVVDFLDVFVDDGNKMGCYWLFLINVCKHVKKLLISNEAVSGENGSFSL